MRNTSIAGPSLGDGIDPHTDCSLQDSLEESAFVFKVKNPFQEGILL